MNQYLRQQAFFILVFAATACHAKINHPSEHSSEECEGTICVRLGIEIWVIDEDGDLLAADNISYTTNTGLSGEVCTSLSDYTCGWISTSTESEVTYTITVHYAGQEISKIVELNNENIITDPCCGPGWYEEVKFEFAKVGEEL